MTKYQNISESRICVKIALGMVKLICYWAMLGKMDFDET